MVSYPCYNVVQLGGISLENCLFLSIFAVFRCFRQSHQFSLAAQNHAYTYQKVKSNGSFEKKRSRAFHIWSHILANMLFSWVEFQLKIGNCRSFFGGFFTARLTNLIPLRHILDFVKNIKVIAVLETTSQDLFRYFPISLLSVHLRQFKIVLCWSVPIIFSYCTQHCNYLRTKICSDCSISLVSLPVIV